MSPPTIPPAPPATHTPHLPSDLHTLKSEYIEHLLRVLREKWDGGAAQYALESRIYGALARLTSTARAAAEEYRELAEAYEGLRGREPVVAGTASFAQILGVLIRSRTFPRRGWHRRQTGCGPRGVAKPRARGQRGAAAPGAVAAGSCG